MSARGAVELVIADIALQAGLFSPPGVASPVLDNLFSAVVIMAIVTTVATPILLKRTYASQIQQTALQPPLLREGGRPLVLPAVPKIRLSLTSQSQRRFR